MVSSSTITDDGAGDMQGPRPDFYRLTAQNPLSYSSILSRTCVPCEVSRRTSLAHVVSWYRRIIDVTYPGKCRWRTSVLRRGDDCNGWIRARSTVRSVESAGERHWRILSLAIQSLFISVGYPGNCPWRTLALRAIRALSDWWNGVQESVVGAHGLKEIRVQAPFTQWTTALHVWEGLVTFKSPSRCLQTLPYRNRQHVVSPLGTWGSNELGCDRDSQSNKWNSTLFTKHRFACPGIKSYFQILNNLWSNLPYQSLQCVFLPLVYWTYTANLVYDYSW